MSGPKRKQEGRTDERTYDELRMEIVRKVHAMSEPWRRCDNRACRRQKRCLTEHIDACRGVEPTNRTELVQEGDAEVMAELDRAIDRRLAEIAAAGGE